jgi:hypothetical protein
MATAGQLLPGEPGGALAERWGSESPRDALHSAVCELSSARQQLSCSARLRSGDVGTAVVFRAWPARSLHVVGVSPLAAELRRLIAAGEAPGWELHPVPGERTPLHALAAPLLRLSGGNRYFNLLDRSGFGYVEEIAATPDECLLDLRNGGPKFLAAVRQAISELWPDLVAVPGDAAPGGREPGRRPLPVLASETLRAVQVVAAWAVAEHGASTAGDLSMLASAPPELPPDVAAAWNHVRGLDLRLIAARLLPEASLAELAEELLAEVDQRRRLIVTSRTFAPAPRRTYDNLVAELGISRERVRQLEADALGKLAWAAVGDRYAPLRWRAVSAARAGTDPTRAIEDAPPWMEGLLRWLPEHAS